MESIIIGENVRIIGYAAFSGLNNLSKITLNNQLEKINGFAFASTGIVSITIPENVKKIDHNIFDNCQNLKTIIMKSQNPPSLDKDSFKNISIKKIIIYVPDNSVDTYINNSQWSKYERYIKPISEKPKD